MTETLDNCPLCHSGQFTFAIRPTDFTVSKEAFSIQHCTNCGLRFTSPRPVEEELPAYYESEAYISHTNRAASPLEIMYQLVRQYTLRQKEKLVHRWTREPKALLDVGCGTGHFLAQCKQAGWQIDGVEVNEKARTQAEETLQQTLFGSLREIEEGKQYNCITLWHVLEHVADLQYTLNVLNNHLAEKGSLILALPNPESYDAAFYKEYWAAYDVPRHLYHFNQQSIEFLAAQQNFTLQAVLPMKFDAFYVSLLSEKYQHGKMRWLQAFNRGLKSNQWARKHQQNYSSLIYILEKV